MSDTVQVARRYTSQQKPWDSVKFVKRDVKLGKFEQNDVEVPEDWSQNATNIVAQKYFRGKIGTPTRETSARQMITRVVDTIVLWGIGQGYFGKLIGENGHWSHDAESMAFRDELTYILLHQIAAFNSPVWFNLGFEEKPQCSACFILSVEDSFNGPNGIKAWQDKEIDIFMGGSGSGVNLSKIRGSMESLSKGGTASGPVSFMRGADSWAGTVKSGGKTRRAAKMVLLDDDHPDLLDFIHCKAREEQKARVLAAAGYTGGMEGDVLASIQYQNANNSVRLSDAFMHAVEANGGWQLRGRLDDTTIKTVGASGVLDEIADAAWQCADPGVQFKDTINRWHTCPEWGPINASNPCSEYMHVDDSACNLASLNLMKFRPKEGGFDVDAFCHVAGIMLMAQDIIVSNSSYPTEQIADNADRFRQLGLGYANLGAYLMAEGMPYDSDEARSRAGAITSLMTGWAYSTSADMAHGLKPYAEFEANRTHHLKVLEMHRAANDEIVSLDDVTADLKHQAACAWDAAVMNGTLHGLRNAQVTVLAPTGTISFMMDCDTTGIEPDFSLKKHKDLVGGGSMEIINGTVPMALARLGYDESHILNLAQVLKDDEDDFRRALNADHIAIFDTAQTISPQGHVRMMAACQPFLSGAISKTVNMPADATRDEIREVIIEAWKSGVKALAIYRDGSKGTQALSTKVKAPQVNEKAAEQAPARRRLPDTRSSITHKFNIDGHEGYLTAGMHEDGTLGEVFINVGKEGSTVGGLLDFAATLLSVSLQYGVPLEDLARKFRNMRFEPHGMTKNPAIRTTTSMPDYFMRWLAEEFGDVDLQEELGVLTEAVKRRKMEQLAVEAEHAEEPVKKGDIVGVCGECGGMMQQTGTCSTCTSCGTTGGCG